MTFESAYAGQDPTGPVFSNIIVETDSHRNGPEFPHGEAKPIGNWNVLYSEALKGEGAPQGFKP